MYVAIRHRELRKGVKYKGEHKDKCGVKQLRNAIIVIKI